MLCLRFGLLRAISICESMHGRYVFICAERKTMALRWQWRMCLCVCVRKYNTHIEKWNCVRVPWQSKIDETLQISHSNRCQQIDGNQLEWMPPNENCWRKRSGGVRVSHATFRNIRHTPSIRTNLYNVWMRSMCDIFFIEICSGVYITFWFVYHSFILSAARNFRQ